MLRFKIKEQFKENYPGYRTDMYYAPYHMPTGLKMISELVKTNPDHFDSKQFPKPEKDTDRVIAVNPFIYHIDFIGKSGSKTFTTILADQLIGFVIHEKLHIGCDTEGNEIIDDPEVFMLQNLEFVVSELIRINQW